MAEIHRKQPLIKKRMEKWKSVVPVPEGFSFRKKEPEPKPKNVHVERLKEGAKAIGGHVYSGLKSLGKSLSDPKTQRRIGDIGYNMGQMGRESFSFGSEPRKRRRR